MNQSPLMETEDRNVKKQKQSLTKQTCLHIRSSPGLQTNNATWSHLFSEIYVLPGYFNTSSLWIQNSLPHLSYSVPPPLIFWPDGGTKWITWMSVSNSIPIQPVVVGIVYRTPQMSTSRRHRRKSHTLSSCWGVSVWTEVDSMESSETYLKSHQMLPDDVISYPGYQWCSHITIYIQSIQEYKNDFNFMELSWMKRIKNTLVTSAGSRQLFLPMLVQTCRFFFQIRKQQNLPSY